MFKRAWLAVVFVSIFAAVVQAETFVIDPAHSSVSFTVSHIIGRVTGHFDKFSGSFNYDPAKPTSWSTEAKIEATSVNTGIEKRDNHLRTAEFFDVQKFPTLSFKSTGITDVNGSHAKLHGDLTLHGVTHPIVLDLDMLGVVKDPFGKGNRAGATAKGHLARLDYGVGPASGASAGMIGKDIEITLEVEAASQ